MTIGDRIKKRRNELGLSAEQLGERIGKDRATVYRYESKDIKNMPISILTPLAKALNVTEEWLLGREKSTNIINAFPAPLLTNDTVDVPVIGEIAAGYNILANEEWNGETVSVPASYLKGRTVSDFFVLSVKGSSMYPHYQDGDKVLILKQDHVLNNGDVAAVLYDSECATLKKIEILNDLVRLVPINPEYEPKEIKGADLERYYVLGVPRLLIREIN